MNGAGNARDAMKPPPRLALVRSARAPVAVIFRRGPSKDVEIVRWNFTDDHFERGDWFHGRLHDRRSHLSADGALLVYCASRFRKPTADDPRALVAWTAVSRVPGLAPIASWPQGDAIGGGGFFIGDRTLWLDVPAAGDGAGSPPFGAGLTIEPPPELGDEEEPVYRRRLALDGWVLRQAREINSLGPARGFRTRTPEVRAKAHPDAASGLVIILERRIDGTRHREHFRIDGALSEVRLPPGPLDWLDWDTRGRAIALSGGRVWGAEVVEGGVGRFSELVDLRRD